MILLLNSTKIHKNCIILSFLFKKICIYHKIVLSLHRILVNALTKGGESGRQWKRPCPTKTPKKRSEISYNLAVRMKFAAKILKVNEFTKFFDNKITKITTIMAKVFNSSSNSPVRVGRKAEEIVSSIQRLIHEFPDCCWYDGSWWCGGSSVTTETECLSITYAADGLHFWYADFYGDQHYEVIPYDAKLLSRLRNLQQKIWIGMYHIVSKDHVKKTVPAWALKRGYYPHI